MPLDKKNRGQRWTKGEWLHMGFSLESEKPAKKKSGGRPNRKAGFTEANWIIPVLQGRHDLDGSCDESATDKRKGSPRKVEEY